MSAPGTTSIRTKVTTALFLAIAAAVALLAATAAVFELRGLPVRTRAVLDSLTEPQVAALGERAAFPGAGATEFTPVLDDVARGELVRHAWLSTPSGVIYHSNGAPASPPVAVPPGPGLTAGLLLDGDRAHYARTVIEGGQVAGVLMLDADIAPLRRSVESNLAALAAVCAVLIAAGIVLARYLRHAITEPVLALADTAAAVHRTGDFTQRHAVTTTDEIGRLGERFNEMLAGIVERDQRLGEVGAQQRAVLAYSGVAIVTSDPTGLVQSFNPAAERFLGYTAAEVIGRLTPVAWHDPEELARRAAERSAEQGRLVSPGFEALVPPPNIGGAEYREWIFIRKDRRRVPGYLVVSTLRNPDGQVIGYCGMVTDLTERRATEDALRASEEQFKLLTEHAPDAIVVFDLQAGRFTAVNRAAEQLFGRSRADLLMRSPVELSPPLQPDGRDSAARAHGYLTAALGGELPVFEWVHLKPDGTPITCEVRLLKLPHSTRSLIRGSLIDIGERKRTELALKALTEDTAAVAGPEFFATAVAHVARKLEVRYALIAELVAGPEGNSAHTLALWSDGPAAPIVYPLAGTPCENVTVHTVCHYAERVAELFPADKMLRDLRAQSYLGVQIRDASGRPMGIVAILNDRPMPESDAARLLLAATASRAATEIMRGRAERDIRRLNAELEQRVRDRTIELEARIAEVERLNRELRSSQAAADRSAASLQESHAKLLAANQELEAFSYSVSHDLRAPLRNITGFIELLRKRSVGKLDAEGDRYSGIVSSEAQRMGSLIDDLLTFSRIGRAELKLQTVQLAELVAEVRTELVADLAGRNIEWRIGELPPVRGDRTLLRQVVANLVQNAVKFTRRREQAVIEIGHQPGGIAGDDGVFFVRDNGAGFNPKYLEKLFRVFQRLHSARDFEGTGIGLANVKRIVTRHGGRVWAEGALDAGATFFFTLRRDYPPTP